MKFGTIPSLLAATSLLTAPLPAAAQDEAQVFKPSGQWALDYGDDYCRLARTFSNGEEELALALERIQPGPFMRMILVSNGIKTYRSAEEIGWNFTPGDAQRKARYTQSQTADGKPYYNLGPVTLEPFVGPMPAFGTAIVRREFSSNAPLVSPPRDAVEKPGSPAAPPVYDRAKERATAKGFDGFVLEAGLTSPVRVETGDLEAPVGALQACADDLIKTWGADPAKHRAGYVPAMPEGGGIGWLPAGMIPFTEFAKFAGGSNQVRLLVDAEGKPTGCHIHWPTLSNSLNEKICKTLMDKARFAPAKDPDGQPTASFWIGNPQFLGPPPPGGRPPPGA